MATKEAAELLVVDGREVRVTNPSKPYFSRPTRSSPSSTSCATTCAVADGRAARHPRPARSCSSASSTAPRASRSTRSARPTSAPSGCARSTLSFPSGRTAEEVVVDDAAGLAWIVNLGCIELHPHPVRAGDLEHPDELRVDLDPGPGVAWDDVRRVALEVQGAARRARPARLAQDERLARHARQRAHRAALELRPRCAARRWRSSREIERRAPDARDRRSGGRRSATASSSTTTRTPRIARPARPTRCGPLPDARVSTPLDWDEVPDCEPADFTVLTVPARFAALGDPHAGIDERGRLARGAARAGRARRGRGPRRRAVAAALSQDGGRGAARRAVARAKAVGPERRTPRAAREDAAHHRRQLARQGRRRSPASNAGRRGTPRPRRCSPSTTSSSTRCAAARRPGRASASTCATFPKASARRRSRPIPTTIRRARGAAQATDALSSRRARARAKIAASSCGGRRPRAARSVQSRGALVGAPAAELRRVAEARALHVVVGDLDDQLRRAAAPTTDPCPRLQRLGRAGQPLSFAPASLLALGPLAPRMVVERVLAVAARASSTSSRRFVGREARDDADVLERARVVVQAEQQRADRVPSPLLCQRKPATTQSHVALVLDLEHRRACSARRRRRAAWP